MEHARAVALRILIDIEEKGAYSHIALQKLTGMERREMALVTELVNGVTRRRLTLDFVLDQFLKFPLAGLTYPIRNDLRLGAYQLLHTRIPPRAAIDESVKLAHKYGHPGIANLVNGVLRSLDRRRENLAMPGMADPLKYLSINYSLPEWIAQLWLERGFEEAVSLAEFSLKPSLLTLRCNFLKISRDALLEKLRLAGIDCGPGVLPEAIKLNRSVPLSEIPGYDEGEWFVQGEGAMLASRLLAPQPGEVVLDIGAAPGGKATHLAELMGTRGRILAIDINQARLELVKSNAKRLGIQTIETIAADASKPLPWQADRILLDAPCSGLGLLSRKPDIRWHQDPEEARKLPALQSRMLESAAKALKPGGTLLYSTCTIRPAENEDVFSSFLDRNRDFRALDLESRLPEEWRRDSHDGMLQLLPHVHKTEGFFVALLEKKS
ncbi:MAG TPA: 16S rRNA (cytosine(967)-C(5))-methyltransferase RsmB [Chroococcales cyanobacterium]